MARSRATRSLSELQTGKIQGTMVSLIRRQVSGTQSQPSRKSWQFSGHKVCRAANPGTHGPSVPEIRKAKSSALIEL
ncbi:hypothetical protein Prudu_001989 [Prunus dulcis]|uniref:Uncharacterized protein n=1 Tax=Prunus dulcis TaxID=3755 RepID=A0A4Y1QPT5_PRUDU|nr:hypothetical protein Prudu_001989 [Prunus dulcis]